VESRNAIGPLDVDVDVLIQQRACFCQVALLQRIDQTQVGLREERGRQKKRGPAHHSTRRT
jgi:hypothetical protein